MGWDLCLEEDWRAPWPFSRCCWLAVISCLLQPSCTKGHRALSGLLCWLPGESKAFLGILLHVQDWTFFSPTRIFVFPCSSCCSNKPEPYQPRQLLGASRMVEQAPRQEGPLPCCSVQPHHPQQGAGSDPESGCPEHHLDSPGGRQQVCSAGLCCEKLLRSLLHQHHPVDV